MSTYFWYYWYKLVDLKKDLEKKLSIKADRIKYRWYLKNCHRNISKNYLPMIQKIMEKPFFNRLDTTGPIIIANKENIPPVVKKFKTAGKALVIPEDVYDFIKDNIVGFDKEKMEAELAEVKDELVKVLN